MVGWLQGRATWQSRNCSWDDSGKAERVRGGAGMGDINFQARPTVTLLARPHLSTASQL